MHLLYLDGNYYCDNIHKYVIVHTYTLALHAIATMKGYKVHSTTYSSSPVQQQLDDTHFYDIDIIPRCHLLSIVATLEVRVLGKRKRCARAKETCWVSTTTTNCTDDVCT